jgi:hypothetical protein
MDYDIIFWDDNDTRLEPLRYAICTKRKAFRLGEYYPTLVRKGGLPEDHQPEVVLGEQLKNAYSKLKPVLDEAVATSGNQPHSPAQNRETSGAGDLPRNGVQELSAAVGQPTGEQPDAPASEVPAIIPTEPQHTPGTEAPADPKSPPLSASRKPAVVLGNFGEKPVVDGKELDPLTVPQHNVIRALIDAGDKGLSKDKLATKSGHGDAHRILKRVAESDPAWASRIQLAGRPGGGYRILSGDLPKPPEVSRRAATHRKRG